LTSFYRASSDPCSLKAGLLDGRKATSHHASIDELKKAYL
jgi:hypothetical protein